MPKGHQGNLGQRGQGSSDAGKETAQKSPPNSLFTQGFPITTGSAPEGAEDQCVLLLVTTFTGSNRNIRRKDPVYH